MRIKSYFAPSVQSAIATARKEFGDDVTLVTSHTAALESRHLGDYEVVFAVEEATQPATATSAPMTPIKSEAKLPASPKKNVAQVIKAVVRDEPVSTAVLEMEPVIAEPAPFKELLEEALATPLSTEENLPAKLECIQSILVEMGIDGPMIRALMTMIERSVSAQIPAVATVTVSAEPAPTAEAVAVEMEPEAVQPETPVSPVPDLTPAELAFYLSVSVGS